MEEFSYSKLALIFARDIMTDIVATVKPDINIGQIAHKMLTERVSGYPVVDDENNLVGIVTLRDLFILLDQIARESSVSLQENITRTKTMALNTIMSRQVHTVTPDTSLDEIIRDVVNSHIHTFPVVQDGKLVGIIGRHDILNAVFVYG